MKSTTVIAGLDSSINSGVDSLKGYLRFSTIPLVLEKDLFNRLCFSNEIVLGSIATLYEKNIYPLMEKSFVRSIEGLPDPTESTIMVRFDYMKNSHGEYVCFDLNTQPGIPGSIVWNACGFKAAEGFIKSNGSQYKFYNAFPVLGRFHKRYSKELPKLALYENENSSLNAKRQRLLEKMCETISGFNFFRYDFVRGVDDLQDYDVIEPFFYINGDLDIVYSNYLTAVETGKPLASNLKLEPYTSKDFAFLPLLEDVENIEKIASYLAKPVGEKNVEKYLFGMGGSGLKKTQNSNWSDQIVTQEVLEPGIIEARVDGAKRRLIYEIGVTSLMHFKKNRLKKIIPCIDLTVKASTKHPISGIDTTIIPALVAQ